MGMVAVLVVIAILLLLGMVLMPAVEGCGRKSSPRIHCVSNLKNVGLSFRIFATDNGDRFPPALMLSNGVDLAARDIVSVYRALSNELSTPRLLFCGSDKKRKPAADFVDFTSEDVSYFVSLTADETLPGTFLAGDRNLSVDGKGLPPGLIKVTTNLALGWTEEMHNHQGNVVMGDGSVQQMSNSRFRTSIKDQDVQTNYFLIP